MLFGSTNTRTFWAATTRSFVRGASARSIRYCMPLHPPAMIRSRRDASGRLSFCCKTRIRWTALSVTTSGNSSEAIIAIASPSRLKAGPRLKSSAASVIRESSTELFDSLTTKDIYNDVIVSHSLPMKGGVWHGLEERTPGTDGEAGVQIRFRRRLRRGHDSEGPQRGRRPAHFPQEEGAGMDDRMEAPGLSPLAHDERAHVVERPLSSDQLSGHHLLCGPEAKEGSEEPRGCGSRDPVPVRETRYPATGAGALGRRRGRRGAGRRLGPDDVQGQARGTRHHLLLVLRSGPRASRPRAQVPRLRRPLQ